MKIHTIILLGFVFCLSLLFCTQCTTNKYQQKFRNRALQAPSGIQALDARGKHKKNSETDPSDWQTAPDFSGLFEVTTPAHPNPVSYNAKFRILINVKANDAIKGLYIYAYQQPNELQSAQPLKIFQQTLLPGFKSITLSPQQFAQGSGTSTIGNIYRIIFLDRQQRVITYGDVRVK
ncbi:MAG TPA: hypothetical protein VE868_04640 [Balneolaceae bacterium]|nr:hypothetical protein [Balneolaceae bacterium]